MIREQLVQDKDTLEPSVVAQLWPLRFLRSLLHRQPTSTQRRAMAEEKQYHEQVTTEETLTHHHTASSHGLHHDHVAQEALGGHTADLGKSYFTSINFIGTVVATCLAQISGYVHGLSVGEITNNIQLPGMGSSGEHTEPHQRGDRTVSGYHLGRYFLDSRICHRLHACRSIVGHLRS